MDFSIKSLRNLKDEKKNSRKGRGGDSSDKMAKIIEEVRGIMQSQGTSQLNINEILKRMSKDSLIGGKSDKVKKDELMDVLQYYKKLQVIYMDDKENVVFL